MGRGPYRTGGNQRPVACSLDRGYILIRVGARAVHDCPQNGRKIGIARSKGSIRGSHGYRRSSNETSGKAYSNSSVLASWKWMSFRMEQYAHNNRLLLYLVSGNLSRYHPSRVLTLVYQPFAVGTIATLAYNEERINTRFWNLFGYILFFVATLLVLVIDLATSGRGGIGTFIGICAVGGAFGIADAHVQGGMVGDLSYMHPELLQSFLAGGAASGVLTSALRLVTKAAFENSKDGLRKEALLFFAITTFFELLCVLLYAFVFPKVPIVKYYRSKAASEGAKTVSADLAAAGIQTSSDNEDVKKQERKGKKQLLMENTDYAIDLFLIYSLTLSIFPGFLSEDTGKHSLGDWYALVLIAMYNGFDLIGRYIPLVKCIKMESRKLLTTTIVCRILLIPAFYFTAKYGDQGWMMLLTSFLGLSNGYLTVCVLTSAPKGYKGPEQNALGNILVSFLLAGIFVGVTLDWLWLIGKGW
ncbi:hypothetical protein AHAS_Ahas03G0129100 [Arachis hypogaea]